MGQYEYIIDKTHPRANEDGQVYLHIIIAEQTLGRYLLPDEVVHHKDFNKLNNDPTNLMVFATRSDHTRFHMNGCDENTLYLTENKTYACRVLEITCVDCGAKITKYGIRCVSCANKYQRKVDRPTFDELFQMLSENNGNFTKVAKQYGVTDNAIRKWCDLYGIPRKPRAYKN
jgi:hypothetical protein